MVYQTNSAGCLRRPARRHGLTAKTGTPGGGGELAFTPIFEEYRAEYRPRNRRERALVETLAEIRCLLNSILSAETILFFPEGASTAGGAAHAARLICDYSGQLVNISLYEQRLHRHFRHVELELRELQLHRKQKDRERHRKIAETPSENKVVTSKFEKMETAGKTLRFFDGSFLAPSETEQTASGDAVPAPAVEIHPLPRVRAAAFGADALLE